MKTIKVHYRFETPQNYTGIVEYPSKTKHWFLNGKLHRETGPCTECKDCLGGNFELCSKPGPAVILPDGTKEWFLNGKLHRETGPCTECKDCFEGNFELCSKPGPAVICPNGTKEWHLNGKFHRENGPAVICPDGTKHWYLNGKEVDKQTVELFYMLKYKRETSL